MRPADLFALALGNYLRSPLRSFLTTAGVAIGTALIVLLIALASGAERNVREQVLSVGDLRTVTVQPTAPGGGFSITPKIIGEAAVAGFAAIERVAAVYRQFEAPSGLVLELGEDGVVRPVGLEAGTPADRDELIAGRHLEVGERGVIVLPSNLARLLAGDPAAAVGREITLRLGGTFTVGGRTIVGSGTPQELRVHVVGVFDELVSSTRARIALDDALAVGAANRGIDIDQLLASVGYSAASVEAEDTDAVGDISRAVRELGYSTISLQQVVDQIDRGFAIFRGILAGIGGVALLVAALGIANTMVMAVLERTREIGIMKAVGASPRDIRRLFLAEAAAVGVVGGTFGLLLGSAGGQLIQLIVRLLNPPGPGREPAEIFSVTVPLLLGALALAVAVALAAGWLPSRRAMQMRPVEALRYE